MATSASESVRPIEEAREGRSNAPKRIAAGLAALILAAAVAVGVADAVAAAASRPVAYVGCSESRLSVHGYHVVGGTRMWPEDSKYDGGFVSAWAGALKSNKWWTAFDQMNTADPGATQVWWQLCVATGQTPAQVDADAQVVLQRIHARLPRATVYVSALPDYYDHVCPSTGLDGFANEQLERDLLVANGEASLGPLMPIAPKADTYPSEPCHSNYQGQLQQGRALLAFFG